MSLDFFNNSIRDADPEVYETLKKELERQQNQIELIASENIASKAVLNAQGSVMTNKYAEGYPGNRYYGGCEFVDEAENIALERVKKLYNCKYANLQSHSGAQANQAVFLALLQPHDTILGMSLASGGHLTHGAKPNLSGKWFNPIQYGVKKDGNDKDLIDYEEVEALALQHKPKLIIAGASAYPRVIDWKKFREIADKVGAYLLVDMAHYSGLIAGKQYPNPIEHAHIVTSTTHKTLRGARSAMILTNDETLIKKINSAVFPGLQGGPLMHVMAGKAVAFGEALKPEFQDYIKRVLDNAKVLSSSLVNNGFKIVTGGTDSHIVWLDLTPKKVTGDKAEKILEDVGIACNKNAIPYDPNPPKITSGLRFGTAAATSRGFNEDDFSQIGDMISEILDNINQNEDNQKQFISTMKDKVINMCKKYPIYKEAF
ncbi:MAG: serine hydroxymethyltransferase [Pelagibacteraceae bacterium]|jgi:glycine hydroxymethyltransferase|nr:serine hydroxymethyltransferase [Pelagibacteraceae bacterium]MBT3902876.1 serine hydroxymethyltransferase [Pelagibacteraceae bacterium]MBT5213777.1 serine hydroxymethyltransferase [Pelagibacteraceae bacterium]MBT6197335.1 serine hydroxymethyltransferase [Pelagibacteraceae bacterium]MBT6354405.1 serine hydroxymethyltransferase [Pelagibacteraceae bacterium]